MTDGVKWVIEWFVPRENAVGGKAYWAPLGGGEFDDEAYARIAFESAVPRPIRLVKVTRDVVSTVYLQSRQGREVGTEVQAEEK